MWARRRLRVTLAMAVTLLLLHSVSAVTQATRTLGTSEQVNQEQIGLVSGSEGQPRAVPPVGWRRTAAGWQHVSTWQAFSVERIPLAEQVVRQRNAEPVWLRELTSFLRRTPPGCFALAQLLAVGLLFFFFSGRVTKRVHLSGDTNSVSQTGLAR